MHKMQNIDPVFLTPRRYLWSTA